MPTIEDEDLSIIAPNIIVRVATPPAYVSTGISESSPVPILNKTIIDIGKSGSEPIDEDTTPDLAGLSREGSNLHFHIKTYGGTGLLASDVVFNIPSPPPPPPPGPPSPPPRNVSTSDVGDGIPDISSAPPFLEIGYTSDDLVGVRPPANPLPLPPSPPPGPPPAAGSPPGPPPPPVPPTPDPWTPLEISSLPSFQNFPSAIFIPAINSCISTPYFSPESKRHMNGVLNQVNFDDPIYLWDCDFNPNSFGKPELNSRPDGSIIVDTQPKTAKNPLGDIFIEPWQGERKANLTTGSKTGKSLNAFSLILGIEAGGNEDQPNAALWSLKILFGDFGFALVENKDELIVSVKGNIQKNINIKPSDVSYVTDNFGNRAYLLTFIPVWNGLLVSHGVPASSDWGDTITFIPKDTTLNVDDQIRYALEGTAPQFVSQIQNSNEKTTTTTVQAGTDPPPFPPKIVVTRNKQRYKAPGIFISGRKMYQVTKTKNKTHTTQYISNTNFDTGKRLTLEFSRCGGVFKFVPIWFTPYSKYHYLFAGAADLRDIPSGAPTRRKKDPTGAKSGGAGPVNRTVPTQKDVFTVPSYNKKYILPILSFTSDPLDFRTHTATIVRSKANPFSCISMEFRSVNTNVRRPIQVWGMVTVDDNSTTEIFEVIPPANGEGVLNDSDLPEARIRRFSISRALDGANGEIVWDRNDPVQGLLPRPGQKIGAIRVGIFGGANTYYQGQSTSGVVFTGIAMGNAQEDSPDENLVRMPLRGREVKLDADGGIVLINPPVFDGWEHTLAMQILADYGGVPLNTDLSTPYNLISTIDINAPNLWFEMGTSVYQAMDTIAKQSSSLFYFNRFGTLIYFDSESSTGQNWVYPDLNIESFSDEPDFQTMRNELIVRARVYAPGAMQKLQDQTKIGFDPPSQVVEIRVPIKTIPSFPWSRQGVVTFGNVIPDVGALYQYTLRTAKAIGRPRATARCQIPPNSNIELFDTINTNWIITSISHEADTQAKRWTMSLGVELFLDLPDITGDAIAESLTDPPKQNPPAK